MTWMRLEWLTTHITRYSSIALGGHFGRNGDIARIRPDAQQVIREMTVTYYAPIREAGEVSVELWVNRVGKTSADFRFAIRSADKTVLHAEGRRESVRFDAKTRRPAPWSEEARSDMTALIRPPDSGDEPGAAVDGRTAGTAPKSASWRYPAGAASTSR
jgi:hypothetical protein